MKKITKKIAVFLASAITAYSIVSPSFFATAYELRNGDTNGDGKVDLYDAINICKHKLKKPELTGVNLKQADCNKDGVVDLYDAIFISRLLASEKKINEVAALINYKRKMKGINSLAVDPAVVDSAMKRASELTRKWSKDMRPDNSSFETIFNEYEIAYEKCANCVGAGPAKAGEFVNALMSNKEVKEKLLNNEFTKIGIGYSSKNDKYKHYWAVFLIK